MPDRLKGKVTIVTGASSGLGRAISLAFAAEGAHLVCSDLRETSRPEGPSSEGEIPTHEAIIKSGGKATFVKCDTTKADQVEALVKAAVDWEHGGRLDVMVNNAGIAPESPAPHAIWEAELGTWEKTFAVNSTGVFLGSRYATAQMIKQEPHSSGDQGWVINLASIYGLVASPLVPAYCASKHAVVGLTRSMALACGPKRIHVNAICPGYVRSALTHEVQKDEQAVAVLNSLHPFANRMGEPVDIARAAVYLASEDASWVNGLCMEVSGGFTAQ